MVRFKKAHPVLPGGLFLFSASNRRPNRPEQRQQADGKTILFSQNTKLFLDVSYDSAVMIAKARRTLPGHVTGQKPFQGHADKVSAVSHLETTPMSSICQTAQESRPANLSALYQTLKEMAARTKPATEKPVVVQGPVIVIRGK